MLLQLASVVALGFASMASRTDDCWIVGSTGQCQCQRRELALDSDRSGTISVAEVRAAADELSCTGIHVGQGVDWEGALANMFIMFDTDGSGDMDATEVQAHVRALPTADRALLESCMELKKVVASPISEVGQSKVRNLAETGSLDPPLPPLPHLTLSGVHSSLRLCTEWHNCSAGSFCQYPPLPTPGCGSASTWSGPHLKDCNVCRQTMALFPKAGEGGGVQEYQCSSCLLGTTTPVTAENLPPNANWCGNPPPVTSWPYTGFAPLSRGECKPCSSLVSLQNFSSLAQMAQGSFDSECAVEKAKLTAVETGAASANTHFTFEVQKGFSIFLSEGSSQAYTVDSVESDTQIILGTAPKVSGQSANWQLGNIPLTGYINYPNTAKGDVYGALGSTPTRFTLELKPGYVIFTPAVGIGVVKEVYNDQHLLLSTHFTASFSDSPFTIQVGPRGSGSISFVAGSTRIDGWPR